MSKQSLIMLPGSLCDEMMWAHQVDILSEVADVKVGDLTKSDSINGLAKDILSEAPNKFSLAGFSLGGIVALEIMRIASERIEKLALIGTNPFPPKNTQQIMWNKFLKMIEKEKFIEITEDYLLPILINDRNRTEELEDLIIKMAENIGAHAYTNQLKAIMNRENQLDILSTIKCPTLTIVGEEDKVCPTEYTTTITDYITNAEKLEVKDSGHLVTLEKPEVVTKVMQNWITS